MRLTEDKFMINEYTKHRRLTRPPNKEAGVGVALENLGELDEDMEFGPNGFRLGSLKEIHDRKDCPFCRLVIQSLRDQLLKHNSQPGEKDHEVDIAHQNINDWAQKDSLCYASWQVDGRILKRDSSGNIIGSRACTRRIRLHWNWPDFDDTYIVLMAAPTRESPGLFLGRTLQSAGSTLPQIRQWTESCVKFHGSACQTRSHDLSKWKSFFGVIDVDDMHLVALPPGARYVALSYVWGKGRVFTTREDNIKGLLSSGGIRKKLSDLPRTIRDSIELVRSLGEHYLWVDALCIIQNSKRSWTLNSRVMDLVYGNAYLTICAADGQDANAGLQGLHRADRSAPEQVIEQYSPEVRLMSTQPAENYIRQSHWNTRAWTFQERLLSTRTLIFVNGRIYFQCRCTARSSDIITEDPSAGWSIEFIESPLLMLGQLSEAPLSVYKKALELYMMRNLTFSKDILAAFNGIGNLVCDALGGSLIHGLPSSHFDWALLWEPRDAPERRLDEDDERFPSWSWCGWAGEMMEYKPHLLSGCEENLEDWLMNHTWITWYIRDFNGNLRLVWEGDSNNAAPKRKDNTWRGYHRSSETEEADYDKYGRYIKEEERQLPRGTHSDDFKLILSECPYGVSIIENSSYTQSTAFIRNSPEKDLPYLQFFTWSAFFRIREDPKQDFGRKFQRYSILDYKDDWCGTIVLERQRWAKVLDPEKPLEFIAISDAKQFDKDHEYDGWAYYIPKERIQSTWDLYYVLLIERDRNDIAYRVGLGKVFKDAFNNSCRQEGKQWKEFILG